MTVEFDSDSAKLYWRFPGVNRSLRFVTDLTIAREEKFQGCERQRTGKSACPT